MRTEFFEKNGNRYMRRGDSVALLKVERWVCSTCLGPLGTGLDPLLSNECPECRKRNEEEAERALNRLFG